MFPLLVNNWNHEAIRHLRWFLKKPAQIYGGLCALGQVVDSILTIFDVVIYDKSRQIFFFIVTIVSTFIFGGGVAVFQDTGTFVEEMTGVRCFNINEVMAITSRRYTVYNWF